MLFEAKAALRRLNSATATAWSVESVNQLGLITGASLYLPMLESLSLLIEAQRDHPGWWHTGIRLSVGSETGLKSHQRSPVLQGTRLRASQPEIEREQMSPKNLARISGASSILNNRKPDW